MAGGSHDRAGPDPPRPLAAWRPTVPLRAYQEDHIIPVDGSLWTSAGGVLLMNTIVDQIVELLV